MRASFEELSQQVISLGQSLFLHQKVVGQQKVLPCSLSVNHELLSFGCLYQTVVKFPAYPFV